MDESPPPAGRQAPPGVVLRVIRMALLAGVVVFGAVVTLQVRDEPPRAPEMAQTLVYANIALLVCAAAGVMWIQRMHAAEPDAARRQTLNVVAWALGEATAMFGGVHYLLVGSPVPFLVGLGMLLASFVLVPIRE